MSKQNTLTSKVFSGLFWKFSERVLAQLVSFVVSIVLARILMPSDYGIVAMITIFITIADVFVTSGLSTALIQKKDADETDFSTIFYCNLVLAIVLYAILFITAPLIAKFYEMPQITPIVRVFGIKIFISSYNSIQHAYVSKHMLFKKFFFSTLGGTIVSGIIGIFMALREFGVWALVAQYLTNSCIDLIVLSLTIDWKPKLLFDRIKAKSLYRFGWKILVADLMGTFGSQLRSLLIGKKYTSADLAYYNKGQQFPELITNNVRTSIESVLFPALSFAGDDIPKVKKMVRKSMKVSSYIIFPLMGGLFAISNSLVYVLLTEKWKDTIPFLQILCISGALTLISSTNLQVFKAIGRSDILLRLEFIKKPLFFIILIWSLRYSVLCMAISGIFYDVIAGIINMWPNKMLIGYSFKEQIKDVMPAALVTISMVLVLTLVQKIEIAHYLLLAIQILVGVVWYIGVSAMFKLESFYYILGVIGGLIKK